ncbi:hypothetical protein AOQ84DRAFT_368666, partial [Glonium stellatum]
IKEHEDNTKGIVKVSRANRCIAVTCRNELWRDKVVACAVDIVKATRCCAVEKSEKWDKFLGRNMPLRRKDLDGMTKALSVEDVRAEAIRVHPKHAPKKVEIFRQKDRMSCNVMLSYAEGEGPGGHVRLWGGQTGMIKLGERGRPRLCGNCASYHLGLCRKDRKCRRCGRGYHADCDKPARCAGCYAPGHAWDNPCCPLRPTRKEDGWHYPNAWAVTTRRRQNEEHLHRVEAARAKAAANTQNAG